MDVAQYGLEDLFAAKWSIMEGRYAIVAMFCLQIYEWIAGYVIRLHCGDAIFVVVN